MAISTNKLLIGSDNLITVDELKDSITGNYENNADSVKATVCEPTSKTLNVSGVAVNKGGGLVGLPLTSHGIAVGKYVMIQETKEYDGVYVLDASTSTDEIVITATYVAETFVGMENVYEVIDNGNEVILSYVAASNGKYQGILEDTLKFIEDVSYYIFVVIVKGSSKSTSRNKWKATYSS